MTGAKRLMLAMLFSIGSLVANSQPFPPPDDPPEGDPDAVPITGLEILLISGGAYGIAQLRRKANSKKTEM